MTRGIENLERSKNLRQLLLRASRVVHLRILDELNQAGYAELKATHTTLLTNLPIEGDSISAVARNAGVTKQAMGRIADELIALGYLELHHDPRDRRSYRLAFTQPGLELMESSFRIMNSIEQQLASGVGLDHYETMRMCLASIGQSNSDKCAS